MKITIHRGINQIGGCITEIATERSKVIIDLGLNLPDNEGQVTDSFANEGAIHSLAGDTDAIIYTHYHGDHIGMFNLVPNGVIQYIGKVAKQVIRCKHTKLGQIKGRERQSANEVETIDQMKAMVGGESFEVGDIKVTPYFVSHSAYESFMLLIEADGKRVLHTGDFRDHSYLGKGLEKVLQHYIKQVDILITEGTMLSRTYEKVRHERELQQEFIAIMKQYKNCFIVSSSTDLERLATIHSAHQKAKPNAPFICDKFQKEVLDIFSASAGKLQKDGLFSFDDVITFESRKALIWNNGFTMLIRCTDKFERWVEKLLPKLQQEGSVIVFSMWGEYINPKSRHTKRDYLRMVEKFNNLKEIHTSGHASTDCLSMVCYMTNPKDAIIPIHSEESCNYTLLAISDELKSKICTQSAVVGDTNIVVK